MTEITSVFVNFDFKKSVRILPESYNGHPNSSCPRKVLCSNSSPWQLFCALRSKSEGLFDASTDCFANIFVNVGIQLIPVVVIRLCIWTLYFQVQIGVVAAKFARGAVAIDDIVIGPGKCENPGDCNFNYNLCSWKLLKTLDTTMQWIRKSLSNGPYTESASAGPVSLQIHSNINQFDL